MGYDRSLLLAAPLLLATPVHAQQADDAAPPTGVLRPAPAQPDNSRRQGPELDVFRAPASTLAPPVVVPPVVVPTVTPPTAIPTPVPETARPAPRPAARATVRPRPAPVVQPARTAPDTPAPVATTPPPQPERITPPSSTADQPAASPAEPPSPTGGLYWQWMIGAVLALLALAAALGLRSRRGRAITPDPDAEAQPAPEPIVAPPLDPAPQDAAPVPEPAPIAPAAPATSDRPWLDMALDITQARFSMLGLTVSYVLLLHNRGDQPAQDVMVRGTIGNAGEGQQDFLQSFLGGLNGMPFHAVVTIQPDETHRLTGELRLTPDQISPVSMGQRSLLIPLAAFDAAYHWGPEDDDPVGTGRTVRAFVVGQEQEPPAERLAPLRLDQGPRQYRRPAARAAAELTPA